MELSIQPVGEIDSRRSLQKDLIENGSRQHQLCMPINMIVTILMKDFQ